MRRSLFSRTSAAITAVLISAAVNAAPVSIEVPELIFNAAAGTMDTTTGDAPRSAANANPVVISVPSLVFRGAEEPMADPATDDVLSPPPPPAMVIKVPELVYGVGEETPAARSSSDSGGPLVIRSAGLRFTAGDAAGDGVDRPGGMNYTTFDSGPISGVLLTADAATVAVDESAGIRYQGLPTEGRHRLRAWLISDGEPRIYREQSTAEGETTGTWHPELAVAGDYRICIALASNTALSRRAPENSDECLAISSVWGDPSNPPKPVIETTPVEPVVGRDFELRYRGMPEGANAKIFVYEAGAPQRANAAEDVATRGNTSGTATMRLYDAGDYEIRIIYERTGRQTRAIRPMRVIPRTQGTSQ